MFGRVRLPLGGYVLFFFFLLGFLALYVLASNQLLWSGVATQGVIVNVQPISCAKSGLKNLFSVQFTDQTGQAHTSTISQCTDGGFNASPGASVTIMYLPDDPTTIRPRDELLTVNRNGPIVTLLVGLITLILLVLWIRQRILKASLKRQEQRTAAERWRAMEGPLANPNGIHQDRDSKP